MSNATFCERATRFYSKKIIPPNQQILHACTAREMSAAAGLFTATKSTAVVWYGTEIWTELSYGGKIQAEVFQRRKGEGRHWSRQHVLVLG
jgi:hypothetical protein